MKKIVLMISVFALLWTMSSCSFQPSGEDSDSTTELTTSQFTDIEISASEGDTKDAQTYEVQLDPSLMASFDSIEDMATFIQATHGSEEEYVAMTPDPIIDYLEARQIARYMESHTLPLPVDGQTVENFHAAYYASRNELVLVYRIEGVTYRFLCWYDATDAIYSGSVLGMLTLDNYEFEMRRENDEFYAGFVPHGTTTLVAVVYSDAEVSDLSLEAFDLEYIVPVTD